jgi:mannose-6-phosphate isomerase
MADLFEQEQRSAPFKGVIQAGSARSFFFKYLLAFAQITDPKIEHRVSGLACLMLSDLVKERILMSELPPVHPRPYLLRNEVQPYSWGAQGGQAYIADLLGVEPEPERPYAELWIGAHPSLPSNVLVDTEAVSLDQWIAAYPQSLLGDKVLGRFGDTLPFLFKVLSAKEVLSIQAHPDKSQAERLHAGDPEHYPDDNHKPELAVALTPVTTLAGLKDPLAIRVTLTRYPELAGFLGPAVQSAFRFAMSPGPQEAKRLVRLAMTALIRRSLDTPDALATAVEKLATRLQGKQLRTEAEELFLEACAQYADSDAGLLAIFLMNVVHLAPGQGLYIPAGVPHAYVRGDMVECMANSDNVVRVGLSPKYVDATALLEILKDRPGELPILNGTRQEKARVYQTPNTEFVLRRWQLSADEGVSVETGGVVGLWLVIDGEIALEWSEKGTSGTMSVERGGSWLIPGCLSVFQIQAKGPAVLYSVTVPL